MENTGGCACGAIRFRVTAPFIATGACHCTDCQKASGGGPNYVALVPKGALEVTGGEAKYYIRKGDSGGEARRAFCPDCGTPLWSEPEHLPFIPVKTGALDEGADLKPAMHIYTDPAAWHVIDSTLPCFPRAPDAG